MPNTIATTRIVIRTRLTLLALGAISLSAVMAFPAAAGDAPDAGAKNPSTCRDAVNHKCLTKPNDGQSSQNQDTRNQANAGAAREAAILANKPTPNDANKYKYGRDNSPFQTGRGTLVNRDGNAYTKLPTGYFPGGGVQTRQGNGGSGGAPGHRSSRTADTRTGATAAVPRSVTTDKVTSTTTRDYRIGATAGPGGPPPAAAIGTKPSATALAAQSGTRDHRH